jgi:hypothetical protein
MRTLHYAVAFAVGATGLRHVGSGAGQAAAGAGVEDGKIKCAAVGRAHVVGRLEESARPQSSAAGAFDENAPAVSDD